MESSNPLHFFCTRAIFLVKFSSAKDFCISSPPRSLTMPLVDVSSLTKVATDDAGLMDQPADPAYKVGLVECYNRNHPTGGSDKLKNKHRFDSIPISNGLIKQGMSCQIINYVHEEHDKHMEVAKQFDANVWRCNPGGSCSVFLLKPSSTWMPNSLGFWP